MFRRWIDELKCIRIVMIMSWPYAQVVFCSGDFCRHSFPLNIIHAMEDIL